MRAALKFRYALIIGLGLFLFGTQIQAQKVKARLSVDYIKIMGDKAFLEIHAKFKGDDGYEPATSLNLNIYKEITEDSLVLQGKVITSDEGAAEFVITGNPAKPDSLVQHIYVVKIEDDSKFKDASKSVKYFDSEIVAETVEDSVAFISATFVDGMGNPIKKKKLDVEIKRLFAPITVNESPFKTDRKGKILVSMADSLPGIDGVITIIVTHDSKKYGTVKYIFDAPIGKVVVDESTFDQRTMWSPPGKTPIFLLVFSGLLIFSVWGIMLVLVSNLIKIYKS